MPSKRRPVDAVPTAVACRLDTWGRSIRAQRVKQHIRSADLCARINISEATLRRIERGDSGASASIYLTALWVLGVFDVAVPDIDPAYWQTDPLARARRTGDDDEHF